MSETKAHPERRAGQTWRLTKPDGMSKDYILSHRYGSTRWACVGFGECGLEDACWWDGRYEMTLIQDVPAAAPAAADRCKAPEWCDFDDAPDSKDPRIQVYVKAKDGNYGVRRGHRIYCSETCAPPLAAQPAETKRFIAIDPAVPGSERTAHRCTGCDWWIDSTCMAEEDVTRLVHEHLAKDHACKPAPQPAPACAYGCSDTQANTACPTHGKPVPAAVNEAPTPVCQRPNHGYVECDGIVNGGLCASHAMLSRLSVGKPARVEGLRRLGHIAGMHDDDLIGGTR